MPPPNPPVESLYVHVPFCVSKCPYCAFYSTPLDPALPDRFVAALVRELELVADTLRPRTVFFGGGTPSILSVRQWETILGAMGRLNLLGAEEWTVECNPASLSPEKARLLRAGGVNRISLGVQSLDSQMLARLGRAHSRQAVFESFDLLRAAGFDNIGLDLIFAIPGQTLDLWRATLAEAVAMGPEHLSSYELTYEEDTRFFEQFQAGKTGAGEDLACAMYEELLTLAGAAGFEQYEVSNFARRAPGGAGEIPGRACRHNVNYWRGGSYHGLGPAAAGFVVGERSKNWSDTRRYCECLERGQRAVETAERLDPLRRAGEIAAFGLRMNAGWPLELFEARTGLSLQTHWAAEIRDLCARGHAVLEPDRFRLTPLGLRFADAAAEMFLR